MAQRSRWGSGRVPPAEAGHWLELLGQATAAVSSSRAPRGPPLTRPVRTGLSLSSNLASCPASRALTAEPLAEGSTATLAELTDPNRRPCSRASARPAVRFPATVSPHHA